MSIFMPEVSNRITKYLLQMGKFLKKMILFLPLMILYNAKLLEKILLKLNMDKANLVNVQEQLDKIQKSYSIKS